MKRNHFGSAARYAAVTLASGLLVLIAGCSANHADNGNGNGGNTVAQALTAKPAAISTASAQNTSTLTYNHPEASSCTGTSTDPSGAALTSSSDFNGSQSVPNGSFTTPPLTTVGTYNYALTCTNSTTGANTTDTASVTVFTPGSPLALFAAPSSVTVGDTSTLYYNHPEATSCTASEKAPDGTTLSGLNDFTGNQPTTSGKFKTAALTQTSNYLFSLTCTNTATGLPNTETASVNVQPAVAGVTNDSCAVGLSNSTPLVNASSTGSTGSSGATYTTSHVSLLPTGIPGAGNPVVNEGRIIDSDLTNFGTLYNLFSLLGGVVPGTTGGVTSETVISSATISGGRQAGFVIDLPNQLLDAGVLQSVQVSTLKRDSNGTEQIVESVDSTSQAGGTAKLKLLGLLGGGSLTYLSFPTTQGSDFDALQLQLGGLLNINNQIDIYYACVADPAP